MKCYLIVRLCVMTRYIKQFLLCYQTFLFLLRKCPIPAMTLLGSINFRIQQGRNIIHIVCANAPALLENALTFVTRTNVHSLRKWTPCCVSFRRKLIFTEHLLRRALPPLSSPMHLILIASFNFNSSTEFPQKLSKTLHILPIFTNINIEAPVAHSHGLHT